MKLPCPYCQDPIQYDLQLVGQKIACPSCKHHVIMTPLSQLSPEYQTEYHEEQERLKKKQETEERKRKAAEYKAAYKRKMAEEAVERKAAKAKLRAELRADAIQRHLADGTSIAPDGFWNRLVYFLDLKFERYLTPQIIRIVWVLLLALSICGLGLTLLARLPTAAPRSLQVINPQRASQYNKIATLEQLILEKEREREQEEWEKQQKIRLQQRRQELQERQQQDEYEVPKAQPTLRDQYAKMSLEQLRNELNKLEQQYPEYLTKTDFTGAAWYALFAAATILSTIITLLICRVICEMCIVIFNIANCLVKMRELLGKAPSPIDSPPAPQPIPQSVPQSVTIPGDGRI